MDVDNHVAKLEWNLINRFNNNNIFECANKITQLIHHFNGAVSFLDEVMTENKDQQKKILQLQQQIKKLERCSNCLILKKKLDDHNEKIQTLAQVFGQITNTKEQSERFCNNFDRVQDIFTEIIDDIPQSNFNLVKESLTNKRKLELCEENIVDNVASNVVLYETPKKRTKLNSKHTPVKSENKNDTEDLVTSPIIGSSRRNINSSFGNSTKSPLTNLSNRLVDKAQTVTVHSQSPKKSTTNKERKELSPSLLGKNSDADKTPSPNVLLNIKKEEDAGDLENRRSLSLLKSDNQMKNENKVKEESKGKVESSKSKKLKQARLSFSKKKPREQLDVSMVNNFCGGMRKFSPDNVITKEDEDEMLKIALQLSLNDSNKNQIVDDDDVIDNSPAIEKKSTHNIKYKTHKVQVHRAETSSKKVEVRDRGDCILQSYSDNEETMILDSQEDAKRNNSPAKDKRRSERRSIGSTSKVNLSPKKLTRSNNSPNLGEPECPYVEPVVRKKLEKKNLKGWGCKKCKEFYEVAFEGNEKLIKEKMNECSKHRGKFNPIRTDTPAGFWDLKMPPTQDTEALNKRNNRT